MQGYGRHGHGFLTRIRIPYKLCSLQVGEVEENRRKVKGERVKGKEKEKKIERKKRRQRERVEDREKVLKGKERELVRSYK